MNDKILLIFIVMFCASPVCASEPVSIQDRLPRPNPGSLLPSRLDAPDAIALRMTADFSTIIDTLDDKTGLVITSPHGCDVTLRVSYIGPLSSLLDRIGAACDYPSWQMASEDILRFNDPPQAERPVSSVPAPPPPASSPAPDSSGHSPAELIAPMNQPNAPISLVPSAGSAETQQLTPHKTDSNSSPQSVEARPILSPDDASHSSDQRREPPYSNSLNSAAAMLPAATALAASIASQIPPVEVPNPVTIDSVMQWTIHKGQSFSDIIAIWCGRAGYGQPVYIATNNPIADYDYAFDGDFISAIRQLVDALAMLPGSETPYVYLSPKSKSVEITDAPHATAAQIRFALPPSKSMATP